VYKCKHCGTEYIENPSMFKDYLLNKCSKYKNNIDNVGRDNSVTI
jgi:hypothetical protein